MSVQLMVREKGWFKTVPREQLPEPAHRKLLDEIRQLMRGSSREDEIRRWFTSTWKTRVEAEGLLKELKAERKRQLPAQPIEVKCKVNAQSNQQMIAEMNACKDRTLQEALLRHAEQQREVWAEEEKVLRTEGTYRELRAKAPAGWVMGKPEYHERLEEALRYRPSEGSVSYAYDPMAALDGGRND